MGQLGRTRKEDLATASDRARNVGGGSCLTGWRERATFSEKRGQSVRRRSTIEGGY